MLVALQCEKASSYNILMKPIFVISLFGCSLALDARGRRLVRPPLHVTLAKYKCLFVWFHS